MIRNLSMPSKQVKRNLALQKGFCQACKSLTFRIRFAEVFSKIDLLVLNNWMNQWKPERDYQSIWRMQFKVP
jgi:hypothetical protein